jgi:hypothetical protein
MLNYTVHAMRCDFSFSFKLRKALEAHFISKSRPEANDPQMEFA